jgi:RNA polymerase sigma-70 factor, ECF subfamily
VAGTYSLPIVSDADDRTLVAAAQSGDRGALDALLRRHHDRLYALCRRLAGNDADGHDALQEALIAVVRGLPRFDGRSAFTTWSYRVATNAALDELRRRSRRPTPGLPDLDGQGAVSPGAVSPGAVSPGAVSPGAGAAAAAGGIEGLVADRLDVDAALAQLPDDFRAAVVLRDLCDLEYAEIADILGVPPGTVRSRIARGRGQLADLMAGPAGPTGPAGNRTTATDRPTTSP